MITEMAGLDCTVVGDVFSDIIVKTDSDKTISSWGGTSYCSFMKVAFGGSGNVAVGLSNLGARAANVGKAGNDLMGKLYIRNLRDKQVVPRIFLDKHLPTGMTLAFVGKGERSFLVSRGANDKLSAEEIKQVDNLIKISRFLYCCGFSLVHLPQKAAILKALELARRYRVTTVFDPGAYNLIKQQKDLFLKIMNSCDILSLNLREAQALTSMKNTKDIVDRLRRSHTLIALKCGENGSFLVSKESIVRTKAYQVKCLDSTGAGDAFTAALIFGLSEELPIESIGRLANWYAARVSQNFGARSFPPRRDVSRFLMTLKPETGSTEIS